MNSSTYSLHLLDVPDDHHPLRSPDTPDYGSTPFASRTPPSSRRAVFNATIKMATLFLISTLVLGGILSLALPVLDDEDRPLLKIPKSFAELQALNGLLKKYRDIYPYRIVICYVTTYLFLQAFSLPGSMYLSILGGAVWGVAKALPLACACVATGATLCYLISAALGPALLTFPKWKTLLDRWSVKIHGHKENLISFLIVLRIAPLPPHWVVNVVCPHVGIGIVPFWISTFLGIFGVTVIHTTIGGGLDDMTSADDFHLISWKNFLGLSAVVVGVLIPVGLRYYFRRELESAADAEEAEGDDNETERGILMDNGDQILAAGPRMDIRKNKLTPLYVDGVDNDFYHDDDSDVILEEAGPALLDQSDDEEPRL